MNKRKPKELHPVNNRSKFNEFFRNLWHGKPPTLKGEKAITGHLTKPSTKAKVTIRINELLKTVSQIKIGVTGDTLVRMDADDYRNGWDFVIFAYKTKSKTKIIDYEVELIKKFQKDCPNKVMNISTNKAGRLTTYNGYYYIYVVYNE